MRRLFLRSTLGAGLAAALLCLGCADTDDPPGDSSAPARAPAADGIAVGTATSGARFVRNVLGFDGPESVRYDPELDAYFVSNIAGYGSAKDDNGFITRLDAATLDSAVVLAHGGTNGVTLHAPKGLALHGDTLWVADIDALRAFDRRTGAPLATIDFAPLGAVQLNDVVIGPDGSINVTDTGIIMGKDGVVHVGPDRVFVVGPGRTIRTALEGPQLRRPNGITWDAAGRRWLLVTFDPFVGEVVALSPDMKTRQVLRTGKGQLDGVEALSDGTILFSSWADSSIHALTRDGDRRILRDLPVPADIGVDTRRKRVAVPLSMFGRVQLWELP